MKRPRWLWRCVHLLVAATNRIHLPAPAVLPAAGAVVGLYAGLLAGVFANLIDLFSAVVIAASGRLDRVNSKSFLTVLGAKSWHFELALMLGVPALLTLWLAG